MLQSVNIYLLLCFIFFLHNKVSFPDMPVSQPYLELPNDDKSISVDGKSLGLPYMPQPQN